MTQTDTIATAADAEQAADSGTAAPVSAGRGAAQNADAQNAAAPDAAASPPAIPAAAPFFARRSVRIVGGIVLPVLIFVTWQLLSISGLFTVAQLPTPHMVFDAGVDLAQRGLLGLYIGISTQRVFLGFAIGGGLGLVLGALVGLSRVWDIFLSTSLGALRAVPSLAWVPLLIIWMHISESSKITLIAIGAFFPVYTTVAASLRHVDERLVEAGRTFGLSGVKLFTTIQLPAVLPAVISGLRLALAQAWLFLVAAELIASSMGLGFLLTDSQNNGRTDRLFLAIVLLAIIGKLSDALIGVFDRWAARRWG